MKILHSTFYILHSKKGIAVLVLLVLSVFLGAPIAYAENEKLRVYYSEPIGAGEKVYHFTACNWIRAYEPLVCSEETKNISTKQCVNEKGKVKEGTKIMGCTHEEDDGNKYEDDAKLYLKADVGKYDSGGCKEEPENQNYKYGPVWAIVDTVKLKMEEGKEENVITEQYGTISSQEKPSEDLIAKISNGHSAAAYPYFRTNLCATWDAVVGNESATDATYKENVNTLNKIKPGNELQDLLDKGCNNDNSKTSLPIGINGSASPIPLVHCSLVERITGETGTDVFSQYVGALYKWAASIVGIVTVLIMVFSGIQISMAGGDSAKIDSAKNRIMQSIIGLVILFLAGLILYTINPGFFTG
ncbi:hypothetical protein HZC21_01185 [Candidatus Peregrinibacteria bacterium]|nr:hypothetical protein [Candidatus Peregrinibacteria bacterium]